MTTKEECNHHGYVHEWGIKEDGEWGAVSYKCKHCEEIRIGGFPSEPVETIMEHRARCDGSCDQCQSVKNIMFSTGAANSNGGVIARNRQTEKELDAYRDARKQGIQPASTKMKDIQSAVRASDAVGFGVRV